MQEKKTYIVTAHIRIEVNDCLHEADAIAYAEKEVASGNIEFEVEEL